MRCSPANAWLTTRSHAANFDAGAAEIDQQAHGFVRRPKIIHALRDVLVVERFRDFQFDDHSIIDHQVSGVFPDDNLVIPDNDATLLCDR